MTSPTNNGLVLGRIYELLTAMHFALLSDNHLVSLGNGRLGFDMVVRTKDSSVYGVNCKYTNQKLLSIDEYRLKKEIENLKNLQGMRWDRKPRMMIISNKEPYPASVDILTRNKVKFLLFTNRDMRDVLEFVKDGIGIL